MPGEITPGAVMFARLVLTVSLLLAAAPAFAASQAIKDLVIANCKTDAGKFCATVIPGGGRIAECLKEHKEQVSAPCVDALLKAKAEADAEGGK
jgi:hypothetical protein